MLCWGRGTSKERKRRLVSATSGNSTESRQAKWTERRTTPQRPPKYAIGYFWGLTRSQTNYSATDTSCAQSHSSRDEGHTLHLRRSMRRDRWSYALLMIDFVSTQSIPAVLYLDNATFPSSDVQRSSKCLSGIRMWFISLYEDPPTLVNDDIQGPTALESQGQGHHLNSWREDSVK